MTRADHILNRKQLFLCSQMAQRCALLGCLRVEIKSKLHMALFLFLLVIELLVLR